MIFGKHTDIPRRSISCPPRRVRIHYLVVLIRCSHSHIWSVLTKRWPPWWDFLLVRAVCSGCSHEITPFQLSMPHYVVFVNVLQYALPCTRLWPYVFVCVCLCIFCVYIREKDRWVTPNEGGRSQMMQRIVLHRGIAFPKKNGPSLPVLLRSLTVIYPFLISLPLFLLILMQLLVKQLKRSLYIPMWAIGSNARCPPGASFTALPSCSCYW